jgi:1-pyrroline-5-carboxylate dehydrogenase
MLTQTKLFANMSHKTVPLALTNTFRSIIKGSYSRKSSTIPSWATLDPQALGVDMTPHYVQNIVQGSWQPECNATKKILIPHPMDKDAHPIFSLPDTSVEELGPFIKSMESVPKSGLHNPLRNVERYLMYGDISRKVRACVHDIFIYIYCIYIYCIVYCIYVYCILYA